MLRTPREALAVVIDHVRPLGAVSLPLRQAAGHCLAQDVVADRDLPPADLSAMDGYAVRAVDTRRARRFPSGLRLIGEVPAGSVCVTRVLPGTCVRVLTGARIPVGADAVVKLEQTHLVNGHVRMLVPARARQNIRFRGEEARQGSVLLQRGALLGAAQVGLCALVGRPIVRVHRRPRVTVLCTGGELRRVGQRVLSHQIRDANGPALMAALSMAGLSQPRHAMVPDNPEILAEKLVTALAASDLVVVTGGVSVGKYDFVPEALKRIGAKVRFHGVAMKPGKPQLYATLSGNRHVFGLPGNPLAVLVGFYHFVLPAVRRFSGLSASACRPILHLELVAPARARESRTEFVQARLVWGRNGPRVRPLPWKGSADLAAGAQSDGVFAVPPGAPIPAGSQVEFMPWLPIL